METTLAAKRNPPGFHAIGVFLIFGATMAAFAAATLIWPGTPLDRAWSLNPTAHRQLAPLGTKIGVLFLLLSFALVTSGVGWLRHQRWGWRLTVIIIGTQIAGDLFNFVRGDRLRGSVGVAIAGALLVYLLTPRVRDEFSTIANHDSRKREQKCG